MNVIGTRRRNTRTGRIVTVKRRAQARETYSSPVMYELEGESGRTTYASERTVFGRYHGISDGIVVTDPTDGTRYTLVDPTSDNPWQVNGEIGAEHMSYDLSHAGFVAAP